jgi:transposase
LLRVGCRRSQAAAMLGVTARQARRLCEAYEAAGASGLVSKSRGKPSNRRLASDLKAQALALVRERYADFGPTLAAEKLVELHGLAVSRETLRHWMKDAGIWRTRKDRIPAPHQPRFRRACLGELVQIDGCEHAWF